MTAQLGGAAPKAEREGAPAVARAVLHKRREGPFLGRHPWVFSGAIQSVAGKPAVGDVIDVVAADGRFVARGLYNPESQIRVRLYTWSSEQPLDASFFRSRLADAIRAREKSGLLAGERSACRLVFSEADGLSGLVVDRYADWLSVQLTSFALASRLDGLLDDLSEMLAPRGIYLRTEKGILEEEGLQATDRLLRGEEPPEPILIEDGDARCWVDLRTGHKTGFYLDQRENRAYVQSLARGLRCADVFSYSGAFSVALLSGGAASVVAVDSSEPALELARRNVEASGMGGRDVSFVRSDAFTWLEERGGAGESLDLIVLDPPRFARTSRGVPQALKAYERLNLLALQCLAPGGLLVTCSCSGRVRRDDFLSVLAGVEAKSGRRLRVLSMRGQAGDHPVSPTCPETEYLKCVVCRVE